MSRDRSVIREFIEDEHGQRLPEHVVKDTPGINNCTGHKLYWVSWENNVVSVRHVTSLPL